MKILILTLELKKKTEAEITEEDGNDTIDKYYLTNILQIEKNQYTGLFSFMLKDETFTIIWRGNTDNNHNSETYGKYEEYIEAYNEDYSLSDLINKLDSNMSKTKYLTSNIFIGANLNDNELLEEIIGDLRLSNDNKYDELIKYLFQLFNIQSIDFIKDNPMIKVNDRYELLSSFGDGLKSTIFIIGSLLSLRNEYFYIDEIENGIHYSLLDNLWEIILTISEEQNVQVFATTHSKECIESFNRVQLDLKNDSEDTYYFEMIKNIKTDKIFTRKLDINQLKYELSHNGEFRG